MPDRRGANGALLVESRLEQMDEVRALAADEAAAVIAKHLMEAEISGEISGGV